MDITKLPFDTDEMLAGLKPWIECESPTYDAAAVDRMMDLAAYELADARRVMPALDDAQAGWLEEPFPPHDWRRYQHYWQCRWIWKRTQLRDGSRRRLLPRHRST